MDKRTIGWLISEFGTKIIIFGLACWMACEVIGKLVSVAHTVGNAMP